MTPGAAVRATPNTLGGTATINGIKYIYLTSTARQIYQVFCRKAGPNAVSEENKKQFLKINDEYYFLKLVARVVHNIRANEGQSDLTKDDLKNLREQAKSITEDNAENLDQFKLKPVQANQGTATEDSNSESEIPRWTTGRDILPSQQRHREQVLRKTNHARTNPSLRSAQAPAKIGGVLPLIS